MRLQAIIYLKNKNNKNMLKWHKKNIRYLIQDLLYIPQDENLTKSSKFILFLETLRIFILNQSFHLI